MYTTVQFLVVLEQFACLNNIVVLFVVPIWSSALLFSLTKQIYLSWEETDLDCSSSHNHSQ